MVRLVIRTLLLAFVFPLLLAACQSELQPPEESPANFKVTVGDSQAVLTWDMEPGQIYSVYYQVGSTVSLDNYVGFATNIASPFTVTGLTDQTQYAFIINASNDGSVPGPSTPVVTVTPGGTGPGQEWTVGEPLFGVGQQFRSVAFGNQTYVAVGDGGVIYIANVSNNSSSGISSWNPASALPVGLANLSSVVYTGGNFLVLTSDGRILTGNNTATWTQQTKVIPVVLGTDDHTGIDDQWNWIAYDGNNVVAVGAKGKVATNHITTLGSAEWTVQSLPFPNLNDLDGVSYINGIFIATGEGGALAVSRNGGLNWTISDPDAIAPDLKNKTLYRAAFAGGVYVVVGDGGTILSSPDATTWIEETAPTNQNLYSIAFGSAEFIVVGTAGTVLQSLVGTDGTWTATTAGTLDLNDVVAGNSVFVAVGDQGTTVSGK